MALLGVDFRPRRGVVIGSAGYTYGSSTHKHAVTALSSGESYSYDANGNMTQRIESGSTYNQTFDAENRLISVTVSSQTTQFVYNGDGTLVKKIKPDGSKTIYVGGIYEVDKTSGGTVTGTKTYYPAAGAMRVGSTLYYTLKDHLGSASVVTYGSGPQIGTIVGEDRFYAFGETRFTTDTMYTDKLYTGQREITGLGIYHYQARFYSPKLGRFLSADTIVPSYANPQSLNRFSYVINNSLRYTDPTGHMFDDGCSLGCGGSTDYEYDPPTNPNNDDDDEDDNDGGGGSQPEPSPDNSDPDCPNWSVCATDLSPEYVQDYWTSMNGTLDLYDHLTTTTAIGSAVSTIAGFVIYHFNNGQPIYTYSLISFVTGIAVVEPTLIGEAILGVGAALAVSSVILDQSANNLDNINDAIVESGAYTNGGTIIANPTSVTITTSEGTTTIPSFLVGQIALNSWASENLIPNP